MVLLAMGSMLGAAIVLLVTKPALVRAVLIQGLAPLLAILAIAVFSIAANRAFGTIPGPRGRSSSASWRQLGEEPPP